MPGVEKKTSWCHDDGTVTVSTPCLPPPMPECLEIHEALVAAMKVLFPENC